VPNWCENELFIIGSKESLLRFEDQILHWENPETKGNKGEVVFDFNKVIPIPQELNNTDESFMLKAAYKILFEGCGEQYPKVPMLLPDLQRFIDAYSMDIAVRFNAFVFQEAMATGKTIGELSFEYEKGALLIRSNSEKYGHSNWYDWCVDNWGTKWSAADAYVAQKLRNEDKTKFVLNVDFKTPWSPPIPIVDKLALDFPDTEFCLKYFECGMAFKGIHRVLNSSIIKSMSASYSGSRGG
jgi:hypothetical protein